MARKFSLVSMNILQVDLGGGNLTQWMIEDIRDIVKPGTRARWLSFLPVKAPVKWSRFLEAESQETPFSPEELMDAYLEIKKMIANREKVKILKTLIAANPIASSEEHWIKANEIYEILEREKALGEF